ncbi:MAG: cell wall-binding repeat-containing protein [Actinobacteria bacterium]|nr:cell wall-binding repeat-containing protein [Actinomycetota bacterium]
MSAGGRWGATRLLLVLALAAGALTTSPPPATAAPYVLIDSFEDGPDGDPGDGICDTPEPGLRCSMRAALMEITARAALGLPYPRELFPLPGIYVLDRHPDDHGEPGEERDGSDGDLDAKGVEFTLRLFPGETGAIEIRGSAVGATTSLVDDRLLDFDSDHPIRLEDVVLRHGAARRGTGETDHWGASGGAIRHLGGSLTLVNSSIQQNATLQDGWGGGLAARDAHVTLTDVTFSDNRTEGGSGGALAFERVRLAAPDARARMTVGDSGFERNTAVVGDGGAIAVMAPNGSVHIGGSSFRDNTAPAGDGGAIHIGRVSEAEISGTTFVTNSAAVDAGGRGGAVRLLEMVDATSTARVHNSSFEGNTANVGGGLSAGSSGASNHLEITGSFFGSNRALAPATPPGTSFPEGPPTCACGGAIAAEGPGTLTVTDTSLFGNHAGTIGALVGAGGGIYVEGTDLAVRGVGKRCPDAPAPGEQPCGTAEANIAGNAGGGVFARTNHAQLSDAIIGDPDPSRSPHTGNQAGRFGGGLVLLQQPDANVPATLTRMTIAGNRAGTGGGLVTGRDVNVNTSTIAANLADSGPGGAIFQAEGALTLTRSHVRGRGLPSDNDAAGDGGGIAQRCQAPEARVSCEPAVFDGAYTSDRPLALRVVDSTIRDVKAGASGGAIALEEGTATVERTVVSRARATTRGGGVAVNRTGVELNATEVSIEDSQVAGPSGTGGTGAGLALQPGSTTSLVRTAVLRNESAGTGGGISVTGRATLVTENVTISANTAAGNGGGLYARTRVPPAPPAELVAPHIRLRHTAVAFNHSTGGAAAGLFVDNAAVALDRSYIATNRGRACTWRNLLGVRVEAFASVYDEDENQDFRSDGFGIQSCEEVFTDLGGLDDDLRPPLRLGFLLVPEESVGLNALRHNGGRSLTHSLRLQSALIDLNPNWHPDSYRFRRPDGSVNVPSELTQVLLDAVGGDASKLPPLKPLTEGGGSTSGVARCPVLASDPDLDQRSFDRPVDGDGDGRSCVDVGPYEFVQGVQIEEGGDAAEVGPNGREVGQFVIERGGDLTKALDVDYVVTGTATAGKDYRPLPGTLTFQPGETHRVLSVVPLADDEVEEPETVTITLLNRLKYSLGRQSRATIQILDADPGVTVTASDPTASEVGDDTGEFTFARGGVLDAPLEIFFRVGGTASAGLDYEALPTTVIIPAGESETSLFIRPIPDEDEDQGETITVEIEPDPAYVIGNPSSALVTIEDAEPVVIRIEGEDRIQTAIAVSKATVADGGASAVVLARADLFPDALAGGPLAQAVGGPMLLTPPDGLDERVADEIERLGVDVVYLLGGESALSRQVARDLVALGVQRVERFGGEDRFATAALIAAEVIGDGTLAYIVEGLNADPARGWPDAVSASGLASAEQRPILLVTTDTMPAATRDAIRDLGITQVRIVGGPVAVSLAVERHLERDLDLGLVRLAGQDRYETSRVVAELAAASGLNPQATWLATGAKFPDALVAGPAAAATGGVLLLVHESDLARSEATEQWLRSRPLPGLVVRLVGGPGAISTAVENTIRAMITR